MSLFLFSGLKMCLGVCLASVFCLLELIIQMLGLIWCICWFFLPFIFHVSVFFYVFSGRFFSTFESFWYFICCIFNFWVSFLVLWMFHSDLFLFHWCSVFFISLPTFATLFFFKFSSVPCIDFSLILLFKIFKKMHYLIYVKQLYVTHFGYKE